MLGPCAQGRCCHQTGHCAYRPWVTSWLSIKLSCLSPGGRERDLLVLFRWGGRGDINSYNPLWAVALVWVWLLLRVWWLCACVYRRHIPICTHVHTHTCSHMYTHMSMHIHTHICTHTNPRKCPILESTRTDASTQHYNDTNNTRTHTQPKRIHSYTVYYVCVCVSVRVCNKLYMHWHTLCKFSIFRLWQRRFNPRKCPILLSTRTDASTHINNTRICRLRQRRFHRAIIASMNSRTDNGILMYTYIHTYICVWERESVCVWERVCERGCVCVV
jgi:hypothetical protein